MKSLKPALSIAAGLLLASALLADGPAALAAGSPAARTAAAPDPAPDPDQPRPRPENLASRAGPEPSGQQEIPAEVRPDRAFSLVYGAGLPLELNNPNLRGNGWNEATALIYSRLYQVDLEGKIQPDLVERHEISDDGLTWTLHLREGVRWHDGSDFGVDDVRATFEALFDPNVECDLDLNLPMVREIEYPGGGRLLFRLHHPAPLLPAPLSEIAILPARSAPRRDSPAWAPSSEKRQGPQPSSSTGTLDNAGTGTRGVTGGGESAGSAEEAGRKPGESVGTPPSPVPGTGPYRFVRTLEDGSLEFHAHAGFHLGKPGIPRIILREIADDSTRAGLVARGELDLAHVKPGHTKGIRRRSNTYVLRMVTGTWRGMPLNLRRPHLQDRRVRRAIDLALDREQIIVNALLGGGRASYQPMPPVSWAFSEDLDRPYGNQQRARRLLKEAGWHLGTDGLRYRQRHRRRQFAAGDEIPSFPGHVPAKSEGSDVQAAQPIGAAPASLVVPAFDEAVQRVDVSAVRNLSTAVKRTEREQPAGTAPEEPGQAAPDEPEEPAQDEPDESTPETPGEPTPEAEPGDGPLTLKLIVWKDEAFRVRASQMIRKQLRRVGIHVELVFVDNAAYSRLADDMGEEYDGFIGGWSALLDPWDNLYKKFHSRGSQNYMGYRNETVDRILDECRTATDPEAAKDLYRRLMEHLRHEAVFLPIAYPDYLFGARTRVGGLKEAVVDSWYEFTRHAWRWRLEVED